MRGEVSHRAALSASSSVCCPAAAQQFHLTLRTRSPSAGRSVPGSFGKTASGNAGSGTHGEQTARALVGVERALIELRPDLVVVAGDVNSTLAEPVTGNPMVHFDWRQAAVRCEKLDWQVVADGQVLAHFGSREMEARQALRAIETLHLTERCQVGGPAFALTFFLSNGEPARGLFFGGANQLCHAKELALKRLGLRWAIWEYDHPLLTLGKNEQEAQQVLQILQHYKVDHICQIGTTDPPPVTIFVRTQ